MRAKNIEGIKVELAIIEPWEFEPSIVKAVVEAWDENTGFAVVKLETQVFFKGQKCIFFRMMARQESQMLMNLIKGMAINCNLVLVNETAVSMNALDFLDGWENNIGLIATVKMIE